VSVEEWARGQAERRYPQGWSDDPTRVRLGRESAEWMAGHAFDALLSDEAVTAVFAEIDGLDSEYRLDESDMRERARAALQAAISAATKGDTRE